MDIRSLLQFTTCHKGYSEAFKHRKVMFETIKKGSVDRVLSISGKLSVERGFNPEAGAREIESAQWS